MSEYWIQDDGSVQFADGDVGDYNHEAVVIQQVQASIIDKCESMLDIEQPTSWSGHKQHSFNDGDYINWDEFLKAVAEAVAREMIENHPEQQDAIEQKLDYDPNSFMMKGFKQSGVTRQELDVANQRIDARDYAMKYWGWKTYRDGNIDTWNFGPNDLKAIVDGISEIAGDSGWSDRKLNRTTFTINVHSNRKSFYLSYGQMTGRLNNPKPVQSATPQTPTQQNLINFGTSQAQKQIQDIELDKIHPAYKRPGVNPFGDSVIHSGFRKFLESIESLVKNKIHDDNF